MSGEVYDVSFDHASLTPAQLVAVGAAGVIGYVGGDPRKCMTRAEVDAYHADELAVATVHENTASWTTWDGAAANRDCDLLAQPLDRPIFFASDQNIAPDDYPTVSAALVAQPGPRPKGIYGESGLVEYCLDQGSAAFGWLTSATSWSSDPAPKACLRQLFAGQEHTPAGVVQHPTIPGTDTNLVLLPDWGQWPFASQPTGDENVIFLIIGDGSGPAGPGGDVPGVTQYFTDWITKTAIPSEEVRDKAMDIAAFKGHPIVSEDNHKPIKTPQAVVDWLIDARAVSGGSVSPGSIATATADLLHDRLAP